MKRAILTAGPQCAGKTTFCKEVVGLVPTIPYISRDEILIEMFGSTHLSPYTGEHQAGLEMMWERVVAALQPENVTLLLDCWNSNDYIRGIIVQKLKSCGVTEIEIWYFTTPFMQCVRNERKRNPREKPTIPNPRYAALSSKLRTGHYLEHYKWFRSENHDLAQQTIPRFLPIGIRHINPRIITPEKLVASLALAP